MLYFLHLSPPVLTNSALLEVSQVSLVCPSEKIRSVKLICMVFKIGGCAGLYVRIPLGSWMFVSSECCELSGRGLCDGPITRPEEPTDCGVLYYVCVCVCVCVWVCKHKR